MYSEDIAIQIKTMSASGICAADIAYYFKMSEEELLTTYDYEIRTAKIDRIVRVAEILYSGILESGHAASAMFYLKNIGSWEELKKEPINNNTDKEIRSITVRLPTAAEIKEQLEGSKDG